MNNSWSDSVLPIVGIGFFILSATEDTKGLPERLEQAKFKKVIAKKRKNLISRVHFKSIRQG
jgi:hypothetical protein